MCDCHLKHTNDRVVTTCEHMPWLIAKVFPVQPRDFFYGNSSSAQF